MITLADAIHWVEEELSQWLARRPLTVEQSFQKRRLKKALRALRAYTDGEQLGDEYNLDGGPR